MIILVRHGEANHHTEDLTGGWTDSVLTQRGEAQIGKMAIHLERFLKGKKVQIVASDFKRAKRSAQIIADRFGSPVISREFLREKNNGEAANKSNTEAKLLKLPRQTADPDNRNYPGGETRREFFNRVVSGMADLQTEYPNQPLLIVAHKGTIQNLLFWWLNLSIDDVCRLAISFNVAAASMSILTVNKWNEHEISLLNYRTDYGKDN